MQTFVNGEKCQDATTNDLIFSVAKLIAVISEAETIRPGDVIATGTPAGAGIGKNPAKFLKPGDKGKLLLFGMHVPRCISEL